MTLTECYRALGGDYDAVIGRLRSERLVQKFVRKRPYSPKLRKLHTAFRAAHTIKGMCQNLSFTLLEKSATALTESLRGGSLDGYAEYLPAVRADYERTVAAIAQFADGLAG